MLNRDSYKHYLKLMRLHKPIGLFLLLWPTLWALWLAGNGHPPLKIIIIFTMGVILMRSAGCVINDIADRDVDGHVARTRERPLATRKISIRHAFILFAVLCAASFLLVLLLNRLTVYLAFLGMAFTIIYPFMKRVTHLPQVGLGVAFAWGVPMAFAAINNQVTVNGWLVFMAAAVWPVIYDTMYAMVDYADDIKIGVKSTAILFGKNQQSILWALQGVFLGLLLLIGIQFKLHILYYVSLFFAALLFIYQQYLIAHRNEQNCFKAFLNNHWVGCVIFLGILLSYS